jgi:hypothetical protein
MSRSSMLYMQRKKTVLDRLWPAPWFATKSLSSHNRPHTVLPVLRDTEHTDDRLRQVPLEEVQAHVEDNHPAE